MITLKTLPQATAQEVFDQCATHLLTQGRKAQREESTECMYRTADGLTCAAGCFIAADEYNPAFEGKKWFGLARDGLVPREHQKLINELQSMHDDAYVADWPKALRRVAAYYGLEVHFP